MGISRPLQEHLSIFEPLSEQILMSTSEHLEASSIGFLPEVFTLVALSNPLVLFQWKAFNNTQCLHEATSW